MVLFEYDRGTLPKADAKEMLLKLSLEDWESYPENIAELIKAILAEDESVSDGVSEPVQPLVKQPEQSIKDTKTGAVYGDKHRQNTGYNNYSKHRK